MVTIIITALVSSTIATFGLLAIQAADHEPQGTKWRYEQLAEIVGGRGARKLWPLVCSGQLSLYDIKVGVLTIEGRNERQATYEHTR